MRMIIRKKRNYPGNQPRISVATKEKKRLRYHTNNQINEMRINKIDQRKGRSTHGLYVA